MGMERKLLASGRNLLGQANQNLPLDCQETHSSIRIVHKSMHVGGCLCMH